MARVPLHQSPVVWLDLETTGLIALVGEIIEFAGIRFENGIEVARLEVKIKPRFIDERPPNAQYIIPRFDVEVWRKGVQEALTINGYTPERWADAVEYEDGIRQIAKFLDGASAVGGHNVSFDMGFIEAKIRDLDIRNAYGKPVFLPYHKLDTVVTAYEHCVPDGLNYLNLSKGGGCCEFLGIPVVDAHRAMADVEMTLKVWNSLVRGASQFPRRAED